MTPTDYHWKRSVSPGAERWILHERWPDSYCERIVGVVVKAKNKTRCRLWNVRCWIDAQLRWETVAVLRDMKTAEAKDAAKLILFLTLKETT